MNVMFSLAASSYGLTLGLVAGAVALAVLAVRRALEGRAGLDFADLATAAVVAIAVGLVPVIGAFIASRRMGRGWGGGATYTVHDPTPPFVSGAGTGPAGRGTAQRFDSFTDRARKVLTLAQDEAQRFNHNYIGTEHLLLGLVREGQGVAARVLMNMGVELAKVRSAVEFIIGRGVSPPVIGEMALTPRAKRVIELAIDEARRLGHNYIGTEHLLLGLMREGEGIAAGVLGSLGVSLDKVRHEVIRTLAESARLTREDIPGSGPADYEAPHPPA
jgi:ClpA/ClpB-like protein